MEPYALPTRPSPTANDDVWDWVAEDNEVLYAKGSIQALRGSLLDDETSADPRRAIKKSLMKPICAVKPA
jgi:hypothetical protein